jgi:hypothetical protein
MAKSMGTKGARSTSEEHFAPRKLGGTPSATPTPRAKAAEAPAVRRESVSCGIHDDAEKFPLRR